MFIAINDNICCDRHFKKALDPNAREFTPPKRYFQLKVNGNNILSTLNLNARAVVPETYLYYTKHQHDILKDDLREIPFNTEIVKNCEHLDVTPQCKSYETPQALPILMNNSQMDETSPYISVLYETPTCSSYYTLPYTYELKSPNILPNYESEYDSFDKDSKLGNIFDISINTPK